MDGPSEDRRDGDLALVRDALAGREAQTEQLGRRLACVRAILASQNARLGHPLGADDLADVAQDTSVVIWRKLASYTGAAPLEAWAYRIAFLELMNAVRKHARRRRAHLDAAEDAARRPVTPSARLAPRFDELHRGLALLEPGEADVIRLKHFEEQTFAEIGARLAIAPGTAKTRYYRGLLKLREFLRNRAGKSRGGEP